MKERVITAFWHRGRKAYLPWMASEIARRLGVSEDEAFAAIYGLVRRGLAVGRRTADRKSTGEFELTREGREVADKIRAAQIKLRTAA